MSSLVVGGCRAPTFYVMGMGSNPWVQEPAPPEPVSDGVEVLGVDYRRWASGAEVSASRRLGRVQVRGSALWVVGAHGGAGTSTWAGLLDAGDAGMSWPVPAVPGEQVRVLVTARTHAAGLEAARAVAVEWLEGTVPGVELLGLVLGAYAPGRRHPKPLARLVRDVSGAFPVVLRVPWQAAWRLSQPSEAHRGMRVRRIIKTINKINNDERKSS